MAFKMKPRGANKNPYGNFIQRGLISPTHQQDTQESVDKEAEANVTWSDWSEWADDPNNPGQEIRTREGEGEAEGYHVGTKKMGNEKWKEWLKTPDGQKYLASKKRKETETREKPKPEETQVKQDAGAEAKNVSQEVQTYEFTGSTPKVWDDRLGKYVNVTQEAQTRVTGGEGEYDEEYEYSDTGVDKDFEGIADEQIEEKADVIEKQDLDQNLSVEVIDEDESPMKQTKLKSFVRNYLHSRSPMKQEKKEEKKKEVKLDDVEVTQVSPSRTEVKVNDKKHSARLGGSF